MSEASVNKGYITPLPGVFAGVVQRALHSQFGTDEAALALIQTFGDRVLGLELTGTGIQLFFQASHSGLSVSADHSNEVATWVRGTPSALFGMAKPDLAKSSWASSDNKVTIDGDASLVRDFELLMKRLDFDWEEKISGILGDVVAHQLALAAKSVGGFARKVAELSRAAGRSSLKNVAAKEAQNFTNRAEFLGFSDEVEQLDNEVKALDKQIDKK